MNTQHKTHNANARAAIVAKFVGPTNHRGARIIVKSQRSRCTYCFPYELSGDEAFKWAVGLYLEGIKFADQKEYGPEATGWGPLGDWSFGCLPSGEYVFVSNI